MTSNDNSTSYNEHAHFDEPASIPIRVYETIRDQYGIPEKVKITSPEDIMMIKSITDLSIANQESFMIITLDASSSVIDTHEITKGLLNHSLVHPREVYRKAILDNALSIIAVHNHPSGSQDPSSQDIEITKQIKASGDIIGISLLDHIIITKNGITSLRATGYL